MDRQATILFVDDNRKSRELLTSMLEARGFAVKAEESPSEAVERARYEDFDVALLDYQMKEMRGTDLARELKRVNAGVPVVVISGLPALASEELAFVNVHLGQGTRVDQLMEAIELLADRGWTGLEMEIATMRWRDAT